MSEQVLAFVIMGLGALCALGGLYAHLRYKCKEVRARRQVLVVPTMPPFVIRPITAAVKKPLLPKAGVPECILKISNPQDPCSICLGELGTKNIQQLPCQHLFHNTCLLPWLIQQPSCPMCRANIITPTCDIK